MPPPPTLQFPSPSPFPCPPSPKPLGSPPRVRLARRTQGRQASLGAGATLSRPAPGPKGRTSGGATRTGAAIAGIGVVGEVEGASGERGAAAAAAEWLRDRPRAGSTNPRNNLL